MAPKAWAFQLAGLWLVRVWFALYGTAYIHPDEHMQNGEVTAGTLLSGSSDILIDASEQGSILGLHTLITWEWRSELPVRSILPIFLTTGLPFLGLRQFFGSEQLGRIVDPSSIFRTQRFVFLCLSGVLDYSVLTLVSQPEPRRLASLLLASSYVTCTFQVRPFSNSVESVLVALCLVLLRQILDKRTRLKAGRDKTEDRGFYPAGAFKRDLHLLAVLAVVGTFTRPTFVAFALPIAYQLFQFLYQVTGSLVQTVGLLLPPLCTAAVAAAVFIAADTYYFRGSFAEIVVTPYNFIKYNLSVENLADHGLHPNWLHVGVNLPMLLGPLFVWFIWCNLYKYMRPSRRRVQKVHFETGVLKQTIIQIIILSLSVLSLQPHQEPRFLTPLVLPMIVLVATAGLPRPRRFFWVTWTIFNIVLVLVFGVLHQGGVVPSLFSLHSTLRNAAANSSINVIYWKTYMPPRHLLGVSPQDIISEKLSFMDLCGAPQDELMAALAASSFNLTYLVSPAPVYLMLPHGISSCMTSEKRIFPHLDLDHIPESIQAGGLDALSLGVYAVKSDCIAAQLATKAHS